MILRRLTVCLLALGTKQNAHPPDMSSDPSRSICAVCMAPGTDPARAVMKRQEESGEVRSGDRNPLLPDHCNLFKQHFAQFSLDRSSEAAFWMDSQARLIYVNEAACRSLGYTRNELLSISFHDIDVDFHAKGPLSSWSKLKQNQSLTFESHQRAKSGRVFPVKVTASCLEFEGRLYNCAFARDISERRSIEERQQVLLEIDQAADLSETLKELLETIHRQLGRIMDTSNFYVALYDEERDEYTFPFSSDPYDCFATFTREQLSRSLTDFVRRTGQPQFIDEETDKRLRAEGVIDLVGHPSKIWLGAPLRTSAGIIGVVSVQTYDGNFQFSRQDLELLNRVAEPIARVIERKRAEAALKESESRYRSILESMGDSIHVVDADLKIVLVNKTLRDWCRGLGVGPVHSNIHIKKAFPFLSERIIQEYNHVFESGETFVSEETTRLADKEVATETRKIPIIRGSKVTNVITVLRDVTDRKQLEEQLRQAQKMEAVGILAGGVAHDFNNILTGITGYAELALKGTDSGSQANRQLKEILDLSDRAGELTKQLLAFSRQQKLSPVIVSTNRLVEGTLRMLRRLIGEDVALSYELCAGSDLIEADTGQLEQVLMNLAVNARDAMPKGGHLTISTEEITIDLEQASGLDITPGPHVLINVADNGSGIDKTTCQRIFEPFFTTKEVGKGTGLGLSTVWGIIRQHGGHIAVESKPGRGTSFRIYLPRATGERDERVPARKALAPNGSEGILLVEDEEQLGTLIEEVLQNQGYRVFGTHSPQDAGEILKYHDEEIDLLLTDVIMPKESGPELFARLREESPKLKVLYMSGYPDRALAQSELLRPGIAFLQKPFGPHELGLKVREVLNS